MQSQEGHQIEGVVGRAGMEVECPMDFGCQERTEGGKGERFSGWKSQGMPNQRKLAMSLYPASTLLWFALHTSC